MDVKRLNTFIRIAIYAILFIILLIFCMHGIPSFDGAMNLQISTNLAENGKYAVNYPPNSLFDAKIQTGAPVLIPIAILMYIFGTSFPVAMVINAAYIFLLILTLDLIIKRLKIELQFFFILFILIVFTPEFWSYGFGVYGEICTLALFCLSVFFMIISEENKNRKTFILFLSGMVMALAYLTKTVILIGIPAYGIMFLYKIFYKKISFKEIFIWIIGFIVPIFLFEIYKFLQMGNFGVYISWWKDQIYAIMGQAGVTNTYNDTNNLFSKIIIHMGKYVDYFGIIGIISIVGLLISFVIVIKKIVDGEQLGYEQILFIAGFLYFVWWIGITSTEKAWSRRIINGVILLEISMIINIGSIYYNKIVKNYDKFSKIKKKKISFVMVIISIITILLSVTCLGNTIKNIDDENKNAIISTGTFIEELKEKEPNSVFMGFGWWQAPVVAYYTEEKFENYYDLKNNNLFNFIDNNYYLVVDFYSNALASSELQNILDTTENELVYEGKRGYKIYIINNILPYKEFSEEDYLNVDKSYFVNSDDYEYLRGFHNYESGNNLRWVSENSAILLKNDGAKYLKIDFNIINLDSMNNKNIDFTVKIDDKEVLNKRINQEGEYTELIDVEEFGSKVMKIEINCNSHIISERDSRQLAFTIDEIGFINE